MACLGLDLVAEGLGPGGRWLRGRADPLKVLGRQKGTLSTAGLPVSPAGVLPASQPSNPSPERAGVGWASDSCFPAAWQSRPTRV